MPLEKATLINTEGGGDIRFMFNPSMLSFSRSINIEQSPGARSSKGDNHTSFKHPNPYTVQIGNIPIDTYEQQTSVLKEIDKFRDGVTFVSSGGQKRPPIYILTWGANNYLRCFIKTLNFKLTLFLSDGTPVRASVDLTLEQVDNPTPQPGQGAASPSLALRKSNGRSTYLS
jgi:Contractile injection system tube protein